MDNVMRLICRVDIIRNVNTKDWGYYSVVCSKFKFDIGMEILNEYKFRVITFSGPVLLSAECKTRKEADKIMNELVARIKEGDFYPLKKRLGGKNENN